MNTYKNLYTSSVAKCYNHYLVDTIATKAVKIDKKIKRGGQEK